MDTIYLIEYDMVLSMFHVKLLPKAIEDNINELKQREAPGRYLVGYAFSQDMAEQIIGRVKEQLPEQMYA